MKLLSFSIFTAAMALVPAFGEVIVADAAGGTSGSFTNFEAVSWTQTGTFSNVAIQAALESNLPNISTGTAYLSDKIGPGATNADVLDTFAISTNNNVPGTLIPLFSGLTLGPGTYFLSIEPNSGLFWVGAGSPTQTLASGVTQGNDQRASGPVGTPPISTSFSTDNTLAPLFQVTGNPASTTTGTPEPSMIGFLSVGLGLVAFARRQRNRSQAV